MRHKNEGCIATYQLAPRALQFPYLCQTAAFLIFYQTSLNHSGLQPGPRFSFESWHVIRPRTKDQYYAIKGKGAFKNRESIKCNTLPEKSINVVASKSHLNRETELYIKALSQKYEVNTVNIGSALKLCLVAEGKADVYPRYAPTMEWDTCAPQIIVEEAGGIVVNIQHKYPLIYNKDLLQNPGFVAACDKELINIKI